MRNYQYEVIFKTGICVFVWAGNAEAARILAKANQIKAGNAWRQTKATIKHKNA